MLLFKFFVLFCFDLCTKCNFHLIHCISGKVCVDLCVAMRMCLLNSFACMSCPAHFTFSLGWVILTTPVSCISLSYFMYFRLPFTKGHFPKMAECAHFHYENVEFGSIQVYLKYFLHTELRYIYISILFCISFFNLCIWEITLRSSFFCWCLIGGCENFYILLLTNTWCLMTPISSRNNIIGSI